MNHKPASKTGGRRVPAGAAVLQSTVTMKLQRAFFHEWADHGYAALRLDRVARRAGVGKAALYRRWASKVDMAADLMRDVGITITDAPDTGSLVQDVHALLASFRRVLRHPLARRIIPDLHAEAARSEALAGITSVLAVARRARGLVVVERAVARGELPAAIDIDLAADLLAAPIYWRMIVTKGPADQPYLNRLASVVVTALKAC